MFELRRMLAIFRNRKIYVKNFKCKCTDDYNGDDCSKRKCPNDCSGHG